MDQNERPRFYEGQYLGAGDLSAASLYGRVAQARHALGAHTWGIAIGLDLVERKLPSGEVQVTVAPGMAWDGYARPVVVLAPALLGADHFRNFQGNTPSNGQLLSVWLRYDETEAGAPSAGFESCAGGDQQARVIESFAIELGEPIIPHGSLTIAGRAVDAAKARSAFNPGAPDVYDESVPYQAFPDGGSLPPWWIPIGKVRWQKLPGQPGRLLARNDSAPDAMHRDSNLNRSFRHHLGVVAETIHAADGVLRLRDRWSDPAAIASDPKNPPVNDLLWVEGNMRVLGDARAAACNPLRFTNAWSAFPDKATNQAEICNDTGDYKTLMIVGNRSAGLLGPGLGRRVSVWDRLDVNGTLQVTGKIGTRDFSADAGYPTGWAGGIHTWDVYAEGAIGVGTKGSVKAFMNNDGLTVIGDARGGPWRMASDSALKKQVAPLRGALDKLLRLRGVGFEWKDPEKMGMLKGPQMGFIAQEVEPVFPGWVGQAPDGYKELAIRGFEALTVEALRELKNEIEQLKARLADQAPAKPDAP
jgi:hypothetical protein